MIKKIILKINFANSNYVSFPTKKFKTKNNKHYIIGGYSNSKIFNLDYFTPYFLKEDFSQLKKIPYSYIVFFFDKKKDNFFVLRDLIGAIPLYFAFQNQTLFLSTDINNIFLENSFLSKKPDALWCHDYCINIIELANNKSYTFYEKVKRLPPGHLLSFYSNKINHSQVITIDKNKPRSFKNHNDFLLGFRAIFEKNLKTLTRNHSNIGLELSGGLDSTTILGALKQLNRDNPKNIFTYSHAQSSNPSFVKRNDERQLIDQTIKLLHLSSDKHRYITRKNLGVINLYNKAFRKGNGVSAYAFAVYSQDFFKLAHKDNVRLIFSGWGGDEMVSNHQTRHKAIYNLPVINKLYKKYQQHKTLVKGHMREKKLINYPIKTIIKDLDGLIPNIEKINTVERVSKIFKEKQTTTDLKDKLLKRITSNLIIGRLEASYHFSEEYGVQYAYPMLSPELIEYMINIPYKILFHPEIKRKFFKDAICSWLPSSIVQRTKDRKDMYGWVLDSYKNDFLRGNNYEINPETDEQLFYSIVHKNWDKKARQRLV